MLPSSTNKTSRQILKTTKKIWQYNPQVCFVVPTYDPEQSHNTEFSLT